MTHGFSFLFFFFNDTATTEIYTLSLHDALPIWDHEVVILVPGADHPDIGTAGAGYVHADRYATSQWMSPATPAPPNSNITAPAPHPLPFFSGGGAVCGRLPPGFPPGRAGAARAGAAGTAGAAFAAGGGFDGTGLGGVGLAAGGTE